MQAARRIVLLTALLMAAPLPGKAQSLALPDMGDPSLQYISGSQEQRLGKALLQRLRQRGSLLEDIQLREYLDKVGQGIALYADSGHPYTFFLTRETSINAFAAPGGYIGVNAGLLLASRDESELAGVLAHEIAHVSQRHIARTVADAQRMSIPMAAAMLASVLVAAGSGNSDIGQAAIAGTMAYGAQRQLDFTRANEREADRIGTYLLSQSGYDPEGMANFFRRLERLTGGFGAQVPEFLRSHPLPSSRIADTQGRLQDTPRRATAHDQTDYHLAKARLRVLTSDNIGQLIRDMETELASGDYQHQAALRYGLALALRQAGRLEQAADRIQALRRRDPDRLAYRIEAAELLLAQGQDPAAWELFEQTRRLYADDPRLAMHYGRALATQGDAQQALDLLEPHRRQSRQPAFHALYAQAAQRADKIPQAHAALAEYYYLIGALGEAVQQAELGLRHPDAGAYQQARLQARLKELQAALQEEQER